MDETATVPRDHLLRLTSLPSSAELAGRLAMLEASQAAGDTVHGLQMMAAKQRVEDGLLRDELQASRPAGCFCLGLGEVDQGSTYARVCGCPDGVALLAEREDRARRARATDVLAFLGRAGVPPRFEGLTFDSYPRDQRGSGYRTVREWRSTRAKPGLFIHGDYGRGKTGLAVAVLREHIERECASGYFVVVPDLLESIRREYGNDESPETGIVARAQRQPFLVFDDLGAERPSEWVTEKLYQVVNYRHSHLLPTVFTSNRPLDELGRDNSLGPRIAFRIAEMCVRVELAGRNLRAEAPGR